MMSLEELGEKVREILPDALFDEDPSTGELYISTGLRVDPESETNELVQVPKVER